MPHATLTERPALHSSHHLRPYEIRHDRRPILFVIGIRLCIRPILKLSCLGVERHQRLEGPVVHGQLDDGSAQGVLSNDVAVLEEVVQQRPRRRRSRSRTCRRPHRASAASATPRESLDQRAVRLFRRRRDLAAVGCDDALAAAAALEPHRNAHDQPTRSTRLRCPGRSIAVEAESCAPSIGDAFLHHHARFSPPSIHCGRCDEPRLRQRE
jgi:hypothetical protein